jgi:hypothetical protein
MLTQEKLHKFLLKKIKKEVGTGQSVLHFSDKQDPIDESLKANNSILKVSSLEHLNLNELKKSFAYVIADMDMPDLDDFNKFLDRISPLIVRPGLLIITASNLCTFSNKIAVLFGCEAPDLKRPSRAVTPAYLRNALLKKGFSVKNRFWQYDNKLLIMADIPVAK